MKSRPTDIERLKSSILENLIPNIVHYKFHVYINLTCTMIFRNTIAACNKSQLYTHTLVHSKGL